ncbi:MAG: hypothetical protein ACP5IL_09035 [Syntrophobacteraceae bacterium]
MSTPIRNLPREHLELFCERMASGKTFLCDSQSQEFLVRLGSKIPPELLAWLLGKRFPLLFFADKIDPKRIFPRSMAFRKRWRHLKKLLYREAFRAGNSQTAAKRYRCYTGAFETTFADLSPMVSAGRQTGRYKAAWRIHGRALRAKSDRLPDGVAPSLKQLYWNGAGSGKLAFWDRLVCCQAEELTQIRRLAHEVSKLTGRVVLSWHNASLGAAGGWAFEDLGAVVKGPGFCDGFTGKVLREAQRIGKSLDFAWAEDLFARRIERLFAPKPPLPFCGSGKHEWSGALAPHQRVTGAQRRSWIDDCRKTWGEGLSLLFALAKEAQGMLYTGKIPSFVLPWIDKFFISSRRRADVVYLAELFGFVSRYIQTPLILFWDDSTHGGAPSLGLAIEDMAAKGLPFAGLGLFNAHLSRGYAAERDDALRIIAAGYPEKSLFALRPMSEKHSPGAFRQIFKDLDWSFFSHYDSSWKDNLAFLYTGTQVFPLLGSQTEIESVCPWVARQGKKYAFGAWLRRFLRYVSLGETCEASGGLYSNYASWANLL